MTDQAETLSFLTSQERLQAYQLLVDGCHHIWSKGKLQKDKAIAVLNQLIPLTKSDPYFLAHLVSYVMKQSEAKDLKVFLTYVASLSSADGMPFSPGSKYMKPNLRYLSAAAVHKLDPKLVDRVSLLGDIKYSVPNHLNDARHLSMQLRTAIEKYLKYREQNPEIMKGIKRAGMANIVKRTAKRVHYNFSQEVREILGWPVKGEKFAPKAPLFDKMDDLQIAEKIRAEKLPYLGALAELARIGKKVSPVIAVAMLEQATGNQAVIMRATFEDAGILADPEVKKLYAEKIKDAKTALDRVETLSERASEDIKQVMKHARAEQRQAQTAGIGKVYVHLDFSGSMSSVQQFASDRGAIIAECVNDPANNFAWGAFGGRGVPLQVPSEFVKDAFSAILFGQTGLGSTDCFALYPEARRFGADVDVFISDQEHTDGDLGAKIKRFHTTHPEMSKPRACVIVNFGRKGVKGTLALEYEDCGIPVSLIDPSTLTESALVIEAVKTAMLGPVSIVDTIMETELLKLPDYYYTL